VTWPPSYIYSTNLRIYKTPIYESCHIYEGGQHTHQKAVHIWVSHVYRKEVISRITFLRVAYGVCHEDMSRIYEAYIWMSHLYSSRKCEWVTYIWVVYTSHIFEWVNYIRVAYVSESHIYEWRTSLVYATWLMTHSWVFIHESWVMSHHTHTHDSWLTNIYKMTHDSLVINDSCLMSPESYVSQIMTHWSRVSHDSLIYATRLTTRWLMWHDSWLTHESWVMMTHIYFDMRPVNAKDSVIWHMGWLQFVGSLKL